MEIEQSRTASPHERQVSRMICVIGSRRQDGLELHSSPDGLFAHTNCRAPTREPSQSKPERNVAKRCCRSGLRLVARWWLSLGLGLVLLAVFPPCSCFGSVLLPPLCSFFFSGDVLKNDHFRLETAGVTLLLPDGRDVGSEAVGTDPRTETFPNTVLS